MGYRTLPGKPFKVQIGINILYLGIIDKYYLFKGSWIIILSSRDQGLIFFFIGIKN